jgi:glycosyltransferase involved in cell wall biosynthesis
MKKTKISIIAPLYNEQENVGQLTGEIIEAMSATGFDYEIILVNDGSSDATWQRIADLQQAHTEIMGIDLAGNYGQTIALRSGFENSTGDIIIFMDGDLQHNPADLPRFIAKIEEGYDMVGGAKAKRPENWLKSSLSRFAHWLIHRISGADMTYFGATFRAYRRYLLEESNMIGDAHRFLGAILARKGIRHTEIPIEIRQRVAGTSSYSLKKVYLVIIDLIFLKFTISYMNKPFRLFGVTGGLMFIIGLLPTVYLVIGSLFFHFHLRIDYLVEFQFSIFIMIMGLLLVSFGLIAEIGIYNYYARGNHSPYSVRRIIRENPKEQ